jgi:MinD superfamily P-loop ATPase
MRIAVASGKGGTGKTTVAANLAWVAAERGRSVVYVDCDVEEPNGALFLKPAIGRVEPVPVSVPEVDPAACDGCGECGRICQYSAIVVIRGKALVYPALCHGCGGCRLVCPTGAIHETARVIGRIETGQAGKVRFVQGILAIGEATSPPVIRAAKAAAPPAELLFVDSPPGTSCPVIETVRDADHVLLVAEPTPFGLHDLGLAVAVLRAIHAPFGLVINRAGRGDDAMEAYCAREGIEILARIPDDRRIAEAYSRGEMICEAVPEYRAVFGRILDRLCSLAPWFSGQRAGNPR